MGFSEASRAQTQCDGPMRLHLRSSGFEEADQQSPGEFLGPDTTELEGPPHFGPCERWEQAG